MSGATPRRAPIRAGVIYANPRNYSRALALSQSMDQPHTYFGSVSAFVSDSAQFFLGTDTLRQSFHTIFQDPHASTTEKVKAAGVGLMTLGMDGVTITSTLIGDPGVGEAAQATEEALLATDATEEAAVAASDATAGDMATGAGAADTPAGDPSYTVQGARAETGGDLTRGGRWMSPEEHRAMTETGMVQEGGGGTTYVAYPADAAAYGSQASGGSRYVEFDVPQSSLRQASKVGWAQIPGPNSLYGRLARMRGEPVPQFPSVWNIEWLLTK